jgi:hypothetical protein
MTLIRILKSALVIGAVTASPAIGWAQVAQAGSPVTDMLTKSKNALNDLQYARADSFARQVLALGSLLTVEQQIQALELRAAAFFPEETGPQKQDSAVVVIRQLLALGGKGVPKDLSWAGLDSLVSLVQRASAPAKVVMASRTPGAFVFVNDQPQGPLSSLRSIPVNPGVEVRLSVRAEKCASWDTTAVFRAADSVRIGIRNLKCTP